MAVNEEAIASKQEKMISKRLKGLASGVSVVFASKTAMVGLFIVGFWMFAAIFAPFLTPYTPFEQDWKAPNQGPGSTHIIGTDELGRDLWSRLIHGARLVLVVLPLSEKYWIPGGTALWGVFLSLLIGTTLGLVSGYYGGWIDETVMRLLDAMMAVPVILLYLLIMAALGASAVNVVIAIAIVGTPGIARLVRSLTLDIRTREYIRAAETRGESPWYIMFVEILPQCEGAHHRGRHAPSGIRHLRHGNAGFFGARASASVTGLGEYGRQGKGIHFGRKPLGRVVAVFGHRFARGRPEPACGRLAGRIPCVTSKRTLRRKPRSYHRRNEDGE